jgi:hypothetical protein
VSASRAGVPASRVVAGGIVDRDIGVLLRGSGIGGGWR